VRELLKRVVRQSPNSAEGWAMLSILYRAEYSVGSDDVPDALDLALAAAQRSVDLALANAFGRTALAIVQFFLKNKVAFRVEALSR
jgi:cytochrome c-type biogenesis protein CcmH/NrfG